MEIQISDACRRPLNELRSRQYDLVGPEGEIILPRSWELTIQPGWTISIVFTETQQQALADEHCAQDQDIRQRLGEWEAQQEARYSTWEAEKHRERERWEEESRAEKLRWEDDRQRERERWEEEMRAERRRWEDNRQRERERWEEEMRAERRRWDVERHRELDQRLADVCRIHFGGERLTPRQICSISPCLCWLSGNRRKCHLR